MKGEGRWYNIVGNGEERREDGERKDVEVSPLHVCKFSKHTDRSLSTRSPSLGRLSSRGHGPSFSVERPVHAHTLTLTPARTTSTHLLLAQVVHDYFSTCGRDKWAFVVLEMSRQGGGRWTRSEKEGAEGDILPVWVCGC